MANTEQALKQFADAVQKLAFEIPAPNPYTPLIVGQCIAARNIALTAASAEAATPDELRRAVRVMTESLNNREWAEHVSTDEDAQALEVAITDLVGKTAPQASQPIGQLSSEVDTYWRPLLEQKTAELVQLRQKYADLASNSQPVSGAVMTDEQILNAFAMHQDGCMFGNARYLMIDTQVISCVRSILSASGQAVSEKAPRDSAGNLKPTYEELEWLYDAQCARTDQLAAKLEAGSDKTLLARIAELEADLATMNRRYADLQSTPAQQIEAPVNVPRGWRKELDQIAQLARRIKALLDREEFFDRERFPDLPNGAIYDAAERAIFIENTVNQLLAAAPAPVQTEARKSEKDAERYTADLRREYAYYSGKCPEHGLTPMSFEEYKAKADAITDEFIAKEKAK